MGSFRKALLLLGLATFFGGFSLTSATAQPPANLPEPPPLPKDMLDKRPMDPPPDLPDPSELIAQLKQLEELLSLPPGKLQRMRQTIEFIEKMSPGEREAMRIRLSQVTRMTDELRQEINELSVLVPEINKSDLSQFWLAADTNKRESIRRQLQSLDESRRTPFLEREVNAFIDHRDEVFARMKQSLEAKRQALEGNEP